jgi:hypothetical protein
MTDHSIARRVALRFAAKALKPEKLIELLKKLRKGSATGIKGAELDQVLAHLGGWRIDETKVLEPQGGLYSRKDEPKHFTSANEAAVKARWEEAKSNEVKHLPDPEHLKLYSSVFMDVSDVRASDHGFTFDYREWRVTTGIRVTSPDHKTWEGVMPLQTFLNGYPSNMGLLKWLRDETSFLKQVSDKLGLDTYELERENAKKQIPTRENSGTCPVCFRNIKLSPRAKNGDKSLPGMVLHGYQRPGTGEVHGNCFGQDWPPFELSKDGTVAYLAAVEKTLGNLTMYLHGLKNGEITSLTRRDIEVHPGDHDWGRVLADKIHDVERLINAYKLDQKRLRRAVETWKLAPLPYG